MTEWHDLSKRGNELKNKGLFFCGYEKLTRKDKRLFKEFMLSLDKLSTDGEG